MSLAHAIHFASYRIVSAGHNHLLVNANVAVSMSMRGFAWTAESLVTQMSPTRQYRICQRRALGLYTLNFRNYSA